MAEREAASKEVSTEPQTHSEKSEEDTAESNTTSQDTDDLTPSAQTETSDDRKQYLWYRCDCDPAQYQGQTHYWLQIESKEARWTEPEEPYWVWDATTQSADPVGLQQPGSEAKKPSQTSIEAEEGFERYNPKIHGNYDPNAPYAKYHDKLREMERATEAGQSESGQGSTDHYAAMATFNKATGAYQSADKTAENHSDYSKSIRQMNAFFDVDAAANAHNGQSLRAERRERKYTKEEIKEMADKRKAKKLKKRLDFYRN